MGQQADARHLHAAGAAAHTSTGQQQARPGLLSAGADRHAHPAGRGSVPGHALAHQEYGASYALLQLPAVRELVTSQQWGEFAAKVVSSHAGMEKPRQSPWQAMIPGLAGTLSQLQGDVQGLTAAVQQQTAAGQVQQAQGAAGPAGQPEHGSEPAVPVRSPVMAAAAGASCRPAAEQPAGCANQQQLSLPEERPQVCSRVRTVKEVYEVRLLDPGSVLILVTCTGCDWCMLSCGVRNGHCVAASSPSVALPAPQEWYIGRWPSGPVAAIGVM
jgi:ferredoxin